MKSPKITFEFYTPNYYQDVKELMRLCFSDIGDVYAPEEELQLLSALYPKGQILCMMDGKVIGANLSRIVPYSKYKEPHNQEMCIDLDVYVSETEIGDSVYGLDVFVNPNYQNLKIGKMIVAKFIKQVFEDNFYCMIGISRVVNYSKYVEEMDCETYVGKVKNREIKDAVLGFHMSYGAEFVNVSPNFSNDDCSSAGYGVTMAVYNPNFDLQKEIYPHRKKILERMLLPA